MLESLAGTWKVELPDKEPQKIEIPGTLDTNEIGYPDLGAESWHPDVVIGNNEELLSENGVITTRFTRKFTFKGNVKLSKKFNGQILQNKRVFIDIERARFLRLFVDNKEIPHFKPATLSTPHVFEVTNILKTGSLIEIHSDNTYPSWPSEGIIYSCAATDETQTNWNGLLGKICIRYEEESFIQDLCIYPKGTTIDVKVTISSLTSFTDELTLNSPVMITAETRTVSIDPGLNTIVLENIKILSNAKKWDVAEGYLHEMTATFGETSKTEVFGLRQFEASDEGTFLLNKRRFFVLSESNCAVFPETGHPPMSVSEWLDILKIYRSYGVNCMRFHSWCPPEAAFIAANQIGMLMQPELSYWDPREALETLESFDYLKTEALEIGRQLANHPSFVMLTLGNELHPGEIGKQRMNVIINQLQKEDSTRLYANGSNVFYGNEGADAVSDFYTSSSYYKEWLRGTSAGNASDSPTGTFQSRNDGETQSLSGYINGQYPNGKMNFDQAFKEIRKEYQKPVFSFEVGQYEVLPDFTEIADFKGVTIPNNYQVIKEKVEAAGMLAEWSDYVQATGELALICYREEAEAALRTKEMSGISLLGLQDFPGQGTALVGVLNSHLKAKPYNFGQPANFAAFFKEQLPLVYLDKYTYTSEESLTAQIKLANYGKTVITGVPTITLMGNNINQTYNLEQVRCELGELSVVGEIDIVLPKVARATKLELTVNLSGCKNTYPLWVYPNEEVTCPESVYETDKLDEKAIDILNKGGSIFLAPKATLEALPKSIQTQFSTDFWSVGTFKNQPGGMGQLINQQHPIFDNFPTESHSNWQWWIMATQRAVILPKKMDAIITEMDSYAFLRPMAKLIEFQVNSGKVLLSTMGLQNLQQYPEARSLLNSIYKYLDSDNFAPNQELSLEELKEMMG